MRLGRGSVVVIELDPTVGREQRGVRPCVVVSDLDVISDQRFPLVCVVPVTGTPGQGLLYPELAPGKSGLARTSFALIDQLRSVDKRRVRRVFGELARHEIAAIDEVFARRCGLDQSGEAARADCRQQMRRTFRNSRVPQGLIR